MLKLVMDDAGDIPADWRTDLDVNVIPINIHFENRMYLSGIDISKDDFYRMADSSSVIPKTSQPSPQQFIDFYQRIADVKDTILSLHASSKLSGTFNSAVIAAQELKGKLKVIPYDSGSGSAAMGLMCREVRMVEKAGATIEEIIRHLDNIRRNINIVLTLETMEYARKSGRVKALPAAIASLINIKPVITLKDGALDMREKVRTRQRSLSRVLEMVFEKVGSQLVNVAVVHSQSLETARELMRKVQETLHVNIAIITDLSIGVAANLGPGTIGIVAYAVIKE